MKTHRFIKGTLKVLTRDLTNGDIRFNLVQEEGGGYIVRLTPAQFVKLIEETIIPPVTE
jgi:hypothetical protein